MPALVFGASIAEILRDFGYPGLLFLMVAENLFPPIPSEAILPLAGYLVGRGEMNVFGVLLFSTAGSVLGSIILYELARRGGRPFTEAFMRRAHIDPKYLESAERWFERRGSLVVLAGRCVPGVRSVVALPAGALHMHRGRYLTLTLVGTLAWNILLVTAGWLLGRNWHRVTDIIGPISTPLLAAVVLIGAAAMVVAAVRHKRTQ
jgi:membrane protein DedA with SNARE-associated domain